MTASIKQITQKSVSCVGVSVNFQRLLDEQYSASASASASTKRTATIFIDVDTDAENCGNQTNMNYIYYTSYPRKNKDL